MKQIGILFFISIILLSCNKSIKPPEEYLDYSDKNILDSLIKATPSSLDTLFLGFRMGMTKKEYKNHVIKLIKEGRDLSSNKTIMLSYLGTRYSFGPGNEFITEISNYSSTGKGEYFIAPKYNENKLVQLNVRVSYESIKGWYEEKLRENSVYLSDKNLIEALKKHNITYGGDITRQKGKVIIYENIFSINYIDLKTLFIRLLYEENKKEIIQKKSNDIKF